MNEHPLLVKLRRKCTKRDMGGWMKKEYKVDLGKNEKKSG